MSALWSFACNRVLYACGCATWLQLVRGQWVSRSWTCYGHESREVSASA